MSVISESMDSDGGRDGDGDGDGAGDHDGVQQEAVREILKSGEDEEAIFMKVSAIGEISEIQKLWNIISLQLLYQSFINGLQRVIQKDVESENAQILIVILEANNQYHLGSSGDGDGGSRSDDDGDEHQQRPLQQL